MCVCVHIHTCTMYTCWSEDNLRGQFSLLPCRPSGLKMNHYAEPSYRAIFSRFENTPSCPQILRKYFSLALSSFQSLLGFKGRLSLKVICALVPFLGSSRRASVPVAGRPGWQQHAARLLLFPFSFHPSSASCPPITS